MRLAPGIGRFEEEVFHHCPPDLVVAKAEKVGKWNSALCKVLMEQCIFYFIIDYRGRHRNGIAIYNATEGSLQQKIWFHGTKMCL